MITKKLLFQPQKEDVSNVQTCSVWITKASLEHTVTWKADMYVPHWERVVAL